MTAARAAVCALALAVAAVAAGCAAGDETAAEVAGVRYPVQDLHAYLAAAGAQGEAEAQRAPRGDAADRVSRWVFFTALELELAGRGVAVANNHEAAAVAAITEADPAFVPGAAGSAASIHWQATALAAFEWLDIEAAGDAPAGEPLRHLCSRHILVGSQAAADEVLDRLAAGEDFGSLAIELSLDTGSGALGGELGCVLEGSFAEPFEEAAYAASPGEAVLARSEFRFHVIEVLSSGAATVQMHPQLDAERLAQMAADAEEQQLVAAELARQQHRQELAAALEADTIASYADRVSVHDRYGHWDPDAFSVVLEPPR